jgi:hypothetical protein
MDAKSSNFIGLATALGANAFAKRAVDTTWKLGAGKKPPTDPTDPDVRLREALLWALLSGAVMGVTRMWVSRHLARSARDERRELAAFRASRR